MIGLAPLAAVALAGWWTPAAPAEVPALTPASLASGAAVWLVELGVSAVPPPDAAAPPVGMLGGFALGAPDRGPDIASVAPVLRVSDRGWIGEPNDIAQPDAIYPARMIEPPALELALSPLPEGARRRSQGVGEVLLANGDGALDYLAGNWAAGGQRVTLLRGGHTRPLHAPYASFVIVGRMRAAGAASGTTRLRLPLVDASADMGVPVSQLYGGTGGADGDADRKGQAKPVLYGIKRNIEPVLVNAGTLIYQIHTGSISAVLAVRDRGAPYTFEANVANHAALAATAPLAGRYRTCLAEGLIRVEPAGGSVSVLTVDARGDVGGFGYASGTPASIALKLLRGPGGLGGEGIAADAFADWPAGEAGLYLRGVTVAQAMDLLCAGLAAWWGPDRLGRITGGQVIRPEQMTPAWDITTAMIREEPQDAGAPSPPRWRFAVGYQVLGRVLSGQDLAGSVSAADRAIWGQPYQVATRQDTAIQAAYPLAQDSADIASPFDAVGDADALALRLLEMHGVPRRSWRVGLSRAGLAILPGEAVRLTWPRHGLANGRVLLVTGVSVRGDATNLTLWG